MKPEVKLDPAAAAKAGPSSGAAASSSSARPLATTPAVPRAVDSGGQLWVEKHKPQNSRELVGNAGTIEWLRSFLTNWCATAEH